MQNCWKGLSPPIAEEDIVNKWYGCIYMTKRGPDLCIGKVTQRFLNDEGELITALEIDCLKQKLGTTDHILKQTKNSVDIFPVLKINPLSNGYWECPIYAEVRKIFKTYKKVYQEKLNHDFVSAVSYDWLDPRLICCSGIVSQRQNTQESLSIYFPL